MLCMYVCVNMLEFTFDLWYITARIDIAGGWSDTPPQAYEHGGKVCTVAVKLKGKVCTKMCSNLHDGIVTIFALFVSQTLEAHQSGGQKSGRVRLFSFGPFPWMF